MNKEDEKMLDGPIVPWFENPDFLTELIKAGISVFIEKGAENEEGLIRYESDGVAALDAVRISHLIKEHNKKY